MVEGKSTGNLFSDEFALYVVALIDGWRMFQ